MKPKISGRLPGERGNFHCRIGTDKVSALALVQELQYGYRRIIVVPLAGHDAF